VSIFFRFAFATGFALLPRRGISPLLWPAVPSMYHKAAVSSVTCLWPRCLNIGELTHKVAWIQASHVFRFRGSFHSLFLSSPERRTLVQFRQGVYLSQFDLRYLYYALQRAPLALRASRAPHIRSQPPRPILSLRTNQFLSTPHRRDFVRLQLIRAERPNPPLSVPARGQSRIRMMATVW